MLACKRGTDRFSKNKISLGYGGAGGPLYQGIHEQFPKTKFASATGGGGGGGKREAAKETNMIISWIPDQLYIPSNTIKYKRRETIHVQQIKVASDMGV